MVNGPGHPAETLGTIGTYIHSLLPRLTFVKKRKTYDDEKSFQVTLLHRERTENEIKRETVKEETW